MYWREDRRRIYALYHSGHWQEFEENWTPDQPADGGYDPPSGLLEPIRGFGKVWREQLGGPEAAIGWATEHEKGGETTIEDFERGVILKIDSTIYLLYRDSMTWQRYSPGIGVPVAPVQSNGRLVFASERDGNGEIYIMNRDGSDQRRLTQHPADDDLPAVSPDGQWIAFQSQRDGDWEIYVMNLDGSGLRRVTNDPGTDRLANWSPDSQWLIFSSDRDGAYELYAIRPEGTELQRLTDDDWYDGHASWSKNGLIVLNSGHDDPTTWEIVVMAADGGQRRQLTDNDVNDWSPNWSPDGQAIVFISRRDGDPAIFLMNADGENPRRLYDSPGYEWGAFFAPDGHSIAFTSDQTGEHEIYVMSIDGSNVVRLTDQGGWYPSWAP
jgi:Tol biopolymer transport system component